MLIQKIHCVAKKAYMLDLKPRDCPFLNTVSFCKRKTVSKWQYFKECMAALGFSG